MAEQDNSETPARTAAVVEYSRWPGWIWAVPIAALLVVGWLAFRYLSYHGVSITIQFDNAAGMKEQSTTVQYRGVRMGTVTRIALSKDGRHVTVTVDMNPGTNKYLRSGTRFWLKGMSPSLGNLSTLKAIMAGPTIIMAPGGGKSVRHFVGIDYRPVLPTPPALLHIYVMSFAGEVGQLKVGTPVTLRGFVVGEVRQIGFSYNLATGTIDTPVIVGLDPSRFHIQGANSSDPQGQPVFNVALQQMIGNGLRARLVRNPPLIGSYAVALAFVPHASKASLDTSGPVPRIPTASTGGVGSIIQRANRVPIDEIGQQVLEITNHAKALIASPDLRASLRHLNHALAGLDVTVHNTGPQVSQLVVSLRRTASELDRTEQSANTVLGGSPTSQNRDMRTALYELTQAARSVRSLADYLDRHPEALVQGRNGNQ